MGYKTNFADNIFYMNHQIKTLQQGLNLEIDPEYFREKIIEDILFIDTCLQQLFSALRDNSYLITRHQHLRDLHRATSLFVDFLDGILDEKYRFAPQLRTAYAKLKACRIEQQKNCDDIRALLYDPPPADEHEDTVSPDEFRFLMEQDHDSEQESKTEDPSDT